MNIRKAFSIVSIVFAIILIIVISLYVANTSTAKCNEGHRKSEDNICYYYSNVCQSGENTGLYGGEMVCTYKPIGFLKSGITKTILISISLIWFLFFIIFFIGVLQRRNLMSRLNQSGNEIILADEAKYIFKKHIAKKSGMTLMDGSFDESQFIDMTESEPALKGKEWFLKFQIEVLSGNMAGVYTVITNLSRGRDWIEAGMSNIRSTIYDEYTRRRDWPIYTPEDVSERMLETLRITKPEKAEELEVELAERRIKSGSEPQIQQQDIPTEPIVIKEKRRPYPYRYPRRR